jgi:hypothetical protein
VFLPAVPQVLRLFKQKFLFREATSPISVEGALSIVRVHYIKTGLSNIIALGTSRDPFQFRRTTIYRLSYRRALYPAASTDPEATIALKYPNDDLTCSAQRENAEQGVRYRRRTMISSLLIQSGTLCGKGWRFRSPNAEHCHVAESHALRKSAPSTSILRR